MKLILYILALVSIGGAAALSMKNIGRHEEQLGLTTAKEAEVRAKRKQVTKKEKEQQSEVALREEAKDQINKLKADKDLKEVEVRNNAKLSASFDSKLEDLVSQKEESQKELDAIKRAFEGESIQLDEVGEVVADLEDKKADLQKTNENLQKEVSKLSESLQENKAVLSDFKLNQARRRASLASNKVSSLITAVDNEWGFVVVKPHSDAIIKQESKLVVIRGSKHIGRLTINAIEKEAGRVLANIDYSSLASGMRIRPGDRVILSKSITK